MIAEIMFYILKDHSPVHYSFNTVYGHVDDVISAQWY